MKKTEIVTTLITLAVFLTSNDISTKAIYFSTKASSKVEETKATIVKEDIYVSPYTGERVDKESFNNSPFMVIVENSRDARPQSGLSQADIVFETMAEGGIPRFIALFQKSTPKEIGPVRSARKYFLDISREYGLPFAHCGGSGEALIAIKEDNLMSMNEIANGSYYWRDSTRKAPHNLYTSGDKLRKLSSVKGYVKPSSFQHKFDDNYWNNSTLPAADNINLNLNKYYTTTYELRNGHYTKSMDNTPALDRYNSLPLAVSNIIIQMTDMKLQSDGSHLDITLIGEGDGYAVSNGKFAKVKWSRKAINSPTILTDQNGREVPLHTGKTWWHITDRNVNVEFK